ncbi:hypothetical protein [Mesorhizobium sp. M1399]|uniref:hypothetical protein n=1 Tax=Mesorhizobium sp. M1399 TaxID=2957096 RepID=UPI00333873FA
MKRKQSKNNRRVPARRKTAPLTDGKALVRANGGSVQIVNAVWKKSTLPELIDFFRWYVPRYRHQRPLVSLRPKRSFQLPNYINTADGTLKDLVRWTLATVNMHATEIRRHNGNVRIENSQVPDYGPSLHAALREIEEDMWSFSAITQILFATSRVSGLDAQRRWLNSNAYVSTSSISNLIYYCKAIACEGDRHPDDVLDILNRFLFNSLSEEGVSLFLYVVTFHPLLHHTLYEKLGGMFSYFPAMDQYEALVNVITSDPAALGGAAELPYIDEVIGFMSEVGDWRANPLLSIRNDIDLDRLGLPLMDGSTSRFLETLGIADAEQTPADRIFETALANEFMFQPQGPRGYQASSLYAVKTARSVADVRSAIFRRTLASRHFGSGERQSAEAAPAVELTFEAMRGALRSVASVFEKRELFRIACLCGLEEARIQDVLILLYDFTSQDRLGVAYFPSAALLQQLTEDDVASIGSDPRVAVALARTASQFGEEGENLVYIAVEQYLSTCSVLKPSELPADSPVLIDFFFEACSTTSLRQSLEFLSKEEMEEQRILILFMLVDADPPNEEFYRAEIHEIIGQQTIDELLQRFHIGKVQCDEDALSKWAITDLAPKFNRLRDFIDAGLLPVERNADVEFLAHLTSGSSEMFTFKVPNNESLDIARTILTELVQRFALDPRYGVDSYLSLGMRHGAVAAHLRSPLSTENILTAKGLNDYSENCFWKAYYLDSGYEDLANSIGPILANFSEAFDSKLELIKEELLQVRRPDKPSGLVVADWSEASVLSLCSRFAEVSDFPAFLSEFTTVFWANVENNLANARNYVYSTLAKELGELLDKLEEDISNATGQQRLSPFSDAVMRARQDLGNAIGDIASWHNVARSTDVEPLRLVDIILAAQKIAKRLYSGFEPKIYFSGDTGISLTYSLHILIEVFKALFTNVYEHSGSLSPVIDVHVTVISDDALGVDFTSECTDLDKAERAAADNNEKIRTGEYEKKLPKEGGSGLAKVARSTVRDGKPNTIVSVDREKSRFRVSMIFSLVNI